MKNGIIQIPFDKLIVGLKYCTDVREKRVSLCAGEPSNIAVYLASGTKDAHNPHFIRASQLCVAYGNALEYFEKYKEGLHNLKTAMNDNIRISV